MPLTLILAISAVHAAFGDSIVATLMVGTHVPTPGFNPANGDIYVSNYDLGTVSVFAGDSNTLLGTIPVGAYPLTPIFNPTNQNMYVSNYGNESVSVIFGNKLSANVHVDNNPLTPAIDPNNGQVYISDYGHERVRRVDPTGTISTVAGNGTTGFGGDGGPATAASLNSPLFVAVDSAGRLYIADSENSRVRRVNGNGVITTVVGAGTYGHSGDGGAAIDAKFAFIDGIAFDASDNLFLADSNNGCVRRVEH